MRKSFKKAVTQFRLHNGILRTHVAKELGINQRTLVQMVEAGILIREARGLYRLSELPPLGSQDLVTVSSLVPKSVITLLSALSFHNVTTQIPYKVSIALPRGTKKPLLNYPPIDAVWLSKTAYDAGIENHPLDGVNVRIYSVEKTIADCFKFRNKIGKDVAIEAIKEYLKIPNRDINALLEFAKINRVKKTIIPYIEATI